MPEAHTTSVARLAQTAIACVALAATVVMPGCHTAKKQKADIVAPVDGWAAPSAIDIENFNGTVTVIVDPLVKEVTPTFKTRASIWIVDAIRKQAIESIKIRTKTIDQDGRAVFSIRTSTKWVDPTQVWVDMTLRMPRCDGVRIFNRGGHVRLSGVTGAIQIDNGEYAGSEGGIEVRTDLDITDPVALVTNNGNVVYQVGAGSTGEFTLDAEGGSEAFNSNIISPAMVHTNGTITTASVGDASNAVLLKTSKGDATVIYMNEPMEYKRRVP